MAVPESKLGPNPFLQEQQQPCHLISMLLQIGLPDTDSLTSRCGFFNAYADYVRYTASLPDSPLAVNDGGDTQQFAIGDKVPEISVKSFVDTSAEAMRRTFSTMKFESLVMHDGNFVIPISIDTIGDCLETYNDASKNTAQGVISDSLINSSECFFVSDSQSLKKFHAPEVLLRSQFQGLKVDIWSAGVTLLYLLMGKTSFPSEPKQSLKEIDKLRGSEELWEVAKLHNREASFSLVLDWKLQHKAMKLRKRVELHFSAPISKAVTRNPISKGVTRNRNRDHNNHIRGSRGINIRAGSTINLIDKWRESLPPVYNQYDTYACVLFTCASAFEARYYITRGGEITISRQDLINKVLKTKKSKTSGTLFRVTLYHMKHNGVVSEEDLPFNGVLHREGVIPQNEARFTSVRHQRREEGAQPNIGNNIISKVRRYYEVGGTGKVEYLLKEKGPVMGGFVCNPATKTLKAGEVHIPGSIGSLHAVLIIGYGEKRSGIGNQSIKYWVVQNSWGTTWCGNGFGYISKTDLDGYDSMKQFWFIETVDKIED